MLINLVKNSCLENVTPKLTFGSFKHFVVHDESIKKKKKNWTVATSLKVAEMHFCDTICYAVQGSLSLQCKKKIKQNELKTSRSVITECNHLFLYLFIAYS